MDASVALETAAAIAAALAVAGAFVAPSPAARALCVLGALGLTPVLLLGHLWGSEQIEPLRDHPLPALGAGLVALVLVAALAVLIDRRPRLFPFLAVAALPFRLPVDTGADTANLLIPLYLVVAAGGLAYGWNRLRVAADSAAPHEREPGRVELALLAVVVLYAVQAVYSSDFDQALENVVFFYVPFALLLKLLTTVEWSRRLVGGCLAILVAQALVFSGFGFYEYATRTLLWNPKVVDSNQFETYFRVNSLFFDPNIYGRFLAIVMLVLATVMLWARGRRAFWLACLALVVLWCGLVLTFSGSSFGGLLVGLALLGALRFGVRPVATLASAGAVVAAALLIAFPSLVNVDVTSGRSIENATSGRAELMQGGVEMFLERPLQGFGSGAFAEQFRERERVSSERAVSASHTIPITVAAEQGVVGLAAYLFLLWTVFAALLRGRVREQGARVAVAAAFAALCFHTLLYAAFLEDPLTWTIIGAGLGIAASARTRTESSSP